MESEEATDLSQNPVIVNGKDITTPHNDWIGMCSPPSAKMNSTFWRAFHITNDGRNEQGKVYVVCNMCGHVVISHNSGTTNIRRHIQSHHVEVFEKLLEIHEAEKARNMGQMPKKRSVMSSPVAAVASTSGNKTKRAKPALSSPADGAKMAQILYCIAANRPFADAEHPAMKNFVKACAELGKSGGSLSMKSATTDNIVENSILKLKTFLREKLAQAEHVSISIDTWRTPNNGTTIFVHARFIVSFKLHCCLLNAYKIAGVPSVAETRDILVHEAGLWDIMEKVVSVVSRSTRCDELMKSEGFNRDFVFVNCFDRRLQNVAEPVIEKMNNVLGPNLKLEGMDGRWWSLLPTVSDASMKKVSLESDNPYVSNDEDLKGPKLLTEALKPFDPARRMLAGNYHCTLSLLPFIQFVARNELLRLRDRNENSDLKAFATAMLSAFDAEFGEEIRAESSISKGIGKTTLLAHALDPRFKQLKVVESDEERENLWKTLLEEMVSLLPESNGTKQATEAPNETTGDAAAAPILRGVAHNEEIQLHAESRIFNEYADVLEGDRSGCDSASWKADCQKELRLYKESKSGMKTENGKEDPLTWWKDNHGAFPTLWRLAKRYLAIPAIASSPNMAFSILDCRMALERHTVADGLPEQGEFLYGNSHLLDA